MIPIETLLKRLDAIRASQPKVYYGLEVWGHIVFIEPKDLQELSERMWRLSAARR